MPSVSVLLPVYDAFPWLTASLASLWRQTFTDFEVVAVNDGSTDGSAEFLDRIAEREPRLRVIHQPHAGVPAALNAGLAASRSPFIARHDADDLSHRRRFELQRAWLAAHPATCVLGSRIRIFPVSDAWVGMRRWGAWHNTLLTHDQIAREVLVDSPLAHASAMIRRRELEQAGGWMDLGWPEDLDLWLRLLGGGARFAKLPQALYSWRQHPASATRREARYRSDRFDALRLDALRHGLLAVARDITVVGVGRGLERWCGLLAAGGWNVRRLDSGRPTAAALQAVTAPAVLVFGAPPARERWRHALERDGWKEGASFVFVV